MSFRELRNFTETMRALGYPRLISMENFRTPNFPLVAEILIWLVKRFDPDADIINDISSENDRVYLIRTTAHLLALKANLKLNTKKLYQADGYAVRELLKVTNLLYDALRVKESKSIEEASELPQVSPVEISMKVDELKNNRFLVGEITTKGAALYDLLAVEPELRELRNSRAARHLEMSQVETAVKDSIKIVEKEIANTKHLMENVAANESTLDSRIEKKQADLQRLKKRLQDIRKVRPPYMEEFEKLEEELKYLYSDYVIKARNLSYLETILDQSEQAEQKRMNEKHDVTKKLLEELRQEEVSIKSGELFQDNLDELVKPKTGVIRPERAKNRTAGKTGGGATRRVFGSMIGDDEDSDSLDDSDSDLLLDGDITEDDDLEITKKSMKEISDDDF